METTASKERQKGVVVPKTATSIQRVAALLAFLLIRLLGATIRFRFDDRAGVFNGAQERKFIFAFWHNRLALSAVIYERFVRKFEPGRRLASLVSASRDGAFLARLQELFRIEPVRGSTSRRGPQALIELTTRAERGSNLAITPDGPRGPRYKIQEGVISAAQVTGLPIVPVSMNLNWKIQSKSWDGFQIPLPFARCEVIAAKAITVSRQASGEERESLRLRLQEVLNEISRD